MSKSNLYIAMKLYSKRCDTKEEAFLKGYLIALDIIDSEAKDILSKTSLRIEKGIPNIYKQVRLRLIREAKVVLFHMNKKW